MVRVYSHPIGAGFQKARLLDNQEGGANGERCTRLRKALGDIFPTTTIFVHRHYGVCDTYTKLSWAGNTTKYYLSLIHI